ncbi:MAG: Ig-like domain-containing protein, partial [Candidatus Moraniibacteriota bacterium]
RLHVFTLFILLGVYFVLAFFDPGLLSYDLRQKFHVLADEAVVLTATVLAPPVQPVVTATAVCDEDTGTLSVALNWADDVNTYTYDVSRDSAPLVSGLASSAYNDTVVVVGTTYQYEVTANGPMGPGSATSDPVSVTTPSACEITAAAPTVTIVSFAGKNVDTYEGAPRVSARQPLFSGTTSMASATLLLTIGSSFSAQFSANSNGYWEWRPPQNLSSGSHTFTVVATDPDDSTRQATATLRFDTLKEGNNDNDAASTSKKTSTTDVVTVTASAGTGTEQGVTEKTSPPFHFAFSLDGSEQSVLQGRELKIFLTLRGLLEKYTHITVPIRYSLTDTGYEVLFSETRDAYITEGVTLRESFLIPSYVAPGEYLFRAEVILDDMNISQTFPVSVRELPLIQLSSGETISYADIVRNLGWLSFFFLLALLLWLLLFIREFALYLQGDREVTEYDLKKAGYIRQ